MTSTARTHARADNRAIIGGAIVGAGGHDGPRDVRAGRLGAPDRANRRSRAADGRRGGGASRARRRRRAARRRCRRRQDPAPGRATRARHGCRLAGAGRSLPRLRRQRVALPAVQRGLRTARRGVARPAQLTGGESSRAGSGASRFGEIRPIRRRSVEPVNRADLFEVRARRSRTTQPVGSAVVADRRRALGGQVERETCSASSSPAPFPGPVSICVSYRSDDLHRRHPLRAAVSGVGPAPTR